MLQPSNLFSFGQIMKHHLLTEPLRSYGQIVMKHNRFLFVKKKLNVNKRKMTITKSEHVS